MNSIRDVACEASSMLSHDELMLKELERRDGIYSFIFHELEAPKVTTSPPTLPPTTKSATNSAATIANHMEDTIACQKMHFTNTISTTDATPTNIATVAAATTSLITSTVTLPTSAVTSTLPKHYHEFLKAWHPPPTLVYNHPKLYAYMANCGFRVRVPTPRFSHLSVPLVRNRRHILKDAPEYKNGGISISSSSDTELCIFKIPDLRALFPHDPDVHAPFKSASDIGGCNGLNGANVSNGGASK